jgi:hypothetical protein
MGVRPRSPIWIVFSGIPVSLPHRSLVMGIPAATIRVTIPGPAGFVRFKGWSHTTVDRADPEVCPSEGSRAVRRAAAIFPESEADRTRLGNRENGAHDAQWKQTASQRSSRISLRAVMERGSRSMQQRLAEQTQQALRGAAPRVPASEGVRTIHNASTMGSRRNIAVLDLLRLMQD